MYAVHGNTVPTPGRAPRLWPGIGIVQPVLTGEGDGREMAAFRLATERSD